MSKLIAKGTHYLAWKRQVCVPIKHLPKRKVPKEVLQMKAKERLG